MQATTGLFNTPHGLLSVLLLVAATVLVTANKMTVDAWQSYSQWILGTFVAGHAATEVVKALGARDAAKPISTSATTVTMSTSTATTPAAVPATCTAGTCSPVQATSTVQQVTPC